MRQRRTALIAGSVALAIAVCAACAVGWATPEPADRSGPGWRPPGLAPTQLSSLRAAYRGEGQRIALIDTGIARSYLDICAGCNVGVVGETGDASGHGTTMAAILTGVPGTGHRGIAPQARVDVFGLAPRQRDLITNAEVVNAVDLAVRRRYDVINISLGSPTPDADLRRSVERAVAKEIVVVAAAGSHHDPPLYPASLAGVHAATAHGNGGDGRHRSIIVPMSSVTLPQYLPGRERFVMRRSSDSSGAAAILSGIAARHRALSEVCSPAHFEDFVQTIFASGLLDYRPAQSQCG